MRNKGASFTHKSGPSMTAVQPNLFDRKLKQLKMRYCKDLQTYYTQTIKTNGMSEHTKQVYLIISLLRSTAPSSKFPKSVGILSGVEKQIKFWLSNAPDQAQA